jgi:hypothetical protein
LKSCLLWLAGFVAFALSVSTSAAALHQYTVRVDSTLERLSVSACFDGSAPQQLVADDTASLYLDKMQLRNPGQGSLTVSGWEAELSDLPENACVDYEVQLRPETTGAQTGGPQTRRIGRDLLTSIGDWFWRPVTMPADADIEVRFELPAGISVSAPWINAGDSARVFRVGPTPREWPGVVAFGGFSPIEINVPGARLKLIMMDSPLPALRDSLRHWIERAALAVTTIYGVFPVANLQVIVAPTSRGSKPVPWAYVSRGGGSAVHLFVRPNRTESDFMRDWSLVHEMSHLFLPYLEWGDGWLAEGLPTYFQNVAMARGGLISPEEAWRRMYQGFESGKDVGRSYTVIEAAQRIGERGIYRRVYWGGAAYMLAADLRLREASNSTPVLADVLFDIHRCCLNGNDRWRADELVAKLDASSGTRVFSELVDEQLESRPFPDYESIYEKLGIRMLGGHPIFVDAPAARYRNAIMAPRQVIHQRDTEDTEDIEDIEESQ